MITTNPYDFKPYKWLRIFVLSLVVIWLVMCLLSSCTTERKVVRYFDNHGFAAAKYCADNFPVDTFYTAGKVNYKIDTFTLDRESKLSKLTPISSIPSTYKDIKIHPGNVVLITRTTIDTAGIIDNAEISSLKIENGILKGKIIEQKTEIKRWKDGRTWWQRYGLILSGIIVTGMAGWLIAKFKLL